MRYYLLYTFLFHVGFRPVALSSPKNPEDSGHTLRQVTQPVLHAEGPHWDSNRDLLYFVDINGKHLYRWDPRSNNVTHADVGADIGFAIPIKSEQHRFIAGRKRKLVYIDWSGEKNATLGVDEMLILSMVEDSVALIGNRFNDAKADSTGTLWAGTMGPEKAGVVAPRRGALYSLPPGANRTTRRLEHVDVSNGIAWNRANDIMYYIDSPTRKVEAFDFSPQTGAISNRREVFSLKAYNLSGVPDGMTIDSQDNLWIALYGGGCIIKVDPVAKTLLTKIDLPVIYATSVAFGGPQLKTLYVTTSRRDLNAEELAGQPWAGSVLALDNLGVVGTRANEVVRRV